MIKNQPRTFRFGLIGGRWGLNYLRTVAGHPEWEIPIIARKSAASLAQPFSDRIVIQDWRKLADPLYNLDAVIIASPPDTHIEMATYFLEKRIPLIIEKPLCLEPEAARQLIDMASRNKTIAWVDHTHLFHPAFRKLKAEIAGRKLLRVQSRAGNHGPFRSDTPVLWDWLPHDVAMLLDLNGGEMPNSITALPTEKKQTDEGMGETIAFSFSFPSGLMAQGQVSNVMLEKIRLFSVKAKGTAFLYDGLNENALIKLPPETPDDELLRAPGEAVTVERRKPLEILLTEFVQAVRSRDFSNSSLILCAKVVEFLSRTAEEMKK